MGLKAWASPRRRPVLPTAATKEETYSSEAFCMFGIGAQEAILIGVLTLIVFGPAGLAEAARECGAALGKSRRWLDETREELASADYPDEWFEDRGRREEDLLDRRPWD
jgi:Sec-independent protein translocase protein TatA